MIFSIISLTIFVIGAICWWFYQMYEFDSYKVESTLYLIGGGFMTFGSWLVIISALYAAFS